MVEKLSVISKSK